MSKTIYFLFVVTILFTFTSCGENPSEYVGDSDPTKSGIITGTVIDKTSGESLSNVKIYVKEIMAESDFLDSALTDDAGRFSIFDVYEQQYYLEFYTKGYNTKILLVSVEDTLRLLEPVGLERHKYPYEYFYIDEFPIEPKNNGYYYRIDPNYFNEDRSWTVQYDETPNRVSKIHRKLDSLSISLIRDDIKVDTLWYKFFQYECGALLIEDKADLVIKLTENNPDMVSHNFIPYDFDISKWQNCVSDTSKMFARYYFFEH